MFAENDLLLSILPRLYNHVKVHLWLRIWSTIYISSRNLVEHYLSYVLQNYLIVFIYTSLFAYFHFYYLNLSIESTFDIILSIIQWFIVVITLYLNKTIHKIG